MPPPYQSSKTSCGADVALLWPMNRLSGRDAARRTCEDPPTYKSTGDEAAVAYWLFAKSCGRAFEAVPGPAVCSSGGTATDARLREWLQQERCEHVASPLPSHQQGAAPSPGFGQSCMAITWKTHSFANPGCLKRWDGSRSQGCHASCVEQVCEELPELGKPEKLAHERPKCLPARRTTRGPHREFCTQLQDC